MDYSGIITIESGKRSGKPCIRGLRMTVTDVLEYLASGMTHEEILQDFPLLTENDILACLAFAADRERKLELLNANLAKHIAKSADVIECEWKRAEYLREQSQSRLFRAAVIRYVADSKFELFDPAQHYGRKEFTGATGQPGDCLDQRHRGNGRGLPFRAGCFREGH